MIMHTYITIAVNNVLNTMDAKSQAWVQSISPLRLAYTSGKEIEPNAPNIPKQITPVGEHQLKQSINCHNGTLHSIKTNQYKLTIPHWFTKSGIYITNEKYLR